MHVINKSKYGIDQVVIRIGNVFFKQVFIAKVAFSTVGQSDKRGRNGPGSISTADDEFVNVEIYDYTTCDCYYKVTI